MGTDYRYILDKSNKKHLCPECNEKTFVLYLDKYTDDYLQEHYGRCDRESKCSYHLNPYQDGYARDIRMLGNGKDAGDMIMEKQNRKLKPAPEPFFIPNEVLRQTLKGYEQNVFIQNLLSRVAYPFDTDYIEKVIAHYYLGTICEGYRAGGVTFPFIDQDENVRAIQVKQFDKENHTTGTDFLHSVYSKHPFINNSSPFDKETGIRRQILPDWIIQYRNNDLKVSCLFGEHLLNKYPFNPIALVEAPKTAIYGTLYFGLPIRSENLIWLAVYNKSSFSFDKIKALKGREVFVFPDLSKDGFTFSEWQRKATQFEKSLPGTRFVFSDLLEQLAPEADKFDGNDLADYLIKQDWRLFREAKIQPDPVIEQSTVIETPKTEIISKVEPFFKFEVFKPERIEQTVKEQPQSWSNDIAELETYFSNIEIPAQSIKLSQNTTITDISSFIDSHFATLKSNNGKRTFLPYLNRLKELKQKLVTN
jgi:hypothetical protein